MGAPETNLGEALAVHGMGVAAAHADDESPEWSETATRHGRVYVDNMRALNPTAVFQGCHVRQFAELRGLPPPPDRRAWGAIIRKLHRAGVIVAVGIGKSPDPTQHAGFATEWRAA